MKCHNPFAVYSTICMSKGPDSDNIHLSYVRYRYIITEKMLIGYNTSPRSTLPDLVGSRIKDKIIGGNV